MKQPPMVEPTYLYREDCINGKVFDAQSDEFEDLANEGWVDSPAKVRPPPAPTATSRTDAPSLGPDPSTTVPVVPAKAEPAAEVEEADKTISALESHRTLLSRFAEAGDTLDLEELLELARLQGIKNLTRRNSLTNIEAAILESMRNEPDGDDEKPN